MASALYQSLSLYPDRVKSQRRMPLAFFLRFALVPVAVGVCYLFPWHGLRSLTADANVALDRLLGVNWARLSADTVSWHGVLYQYVISCTFADVLCGAIPLVWNLRRSILWNVAYLLAMGAGMFAFNIFRLSVSDAIFAAGISWAVAHSVISGISYFAVWVWLWESHSPQWRQPWQAASQAG
ncbi:MAG: hypothetical protein H0X25_13515 [Acidobacteriales bacterium]|nr:hypothetical protein [Terriglobales bacterium]